MKALALIDVDGVLNPHGTAACPPGYTEHELFPGELVRVRREHGPLLLRLSTRYELVWATYWEHEANRLLAPLLGLPRLPVIHCAGPPGSHQDKLLGIAPWVADRPLVWFDDLHSAAAHEWAASRTALTRLIHVDPIAGLTGDHIEQALLP
ncbi:HAD domain-containing protein [Catellatospora paridis]|uniref:HAD domain-containing protein n=1 Tax=Catellatospora paridis TaxID=1617086 RepID=UPI0012D3A083|nr:HAD domain-containing protein [Catellatospora paridis]